MSWLDVTEWPELDFQYDGNRNTRWPVNLFIFILMLLKLTVPQLVKHLPASHGTGSFTKPPSAKWIQSGPFHFVSTRLILILYSHLCLCPPSSLVPSGFTPKPSVYFCPLYALHVPPILSSVIYL